MRDVAFRMNVLRNGAQLTQMTWPTDSPPNIYVDKDAEIKGSLSATLCPSEKADLLSDELQPVMIVNGVEMPLGVFQVTTIDNSLTEFGKLWRIEAYDRCWRVQQSRTENIRHFSAGTPYLTAVQQLLTEAGITLILASPSDAVLATDREDWQAGTDYLAICNDLLAEINYNPVWFDARGVCRLEPYREPNSSRIDHAYSSRDMQMLPMADERTQAVDLFDRPNVFVRICSNPDLPAPMTATAVNDSPTSGTSTFKRRMRIVDVATVKNIASQAELQALVNKLRNESMFATKTITFSGLAEGGHGVGDVISIDDADIGGIYEETAWSLTLAAGELMEHTARRAVIA